MSILNLPNEIINEILSFFIYKKSDFDYYGGRGFKSTVSNVLYKPIDKYTIKNYYV